MDKITDLIATSLSEGCGKKSSKRKKLAKTMRSLRSESRTSEYFAGLIKAATESLEAFLQED